LAALGDFDFQPVSSEMSSTSEATSSISTSYSVPFSGAADRDGSSAVVLVQCYLRLAKVHHGIADIVSGGRHPPDKAYLFTEFLANGSEQRSAVRTKTHLQRVDSLAAGS
jgi:hypothetical protein